MISLKVKEKLSHITHEAIGLLGNLLVLTSYRQLNLYSVLVMYGGAWTSPTKLRFHTDDTGAIIGVDPI